MTGRTLHVPAGDTLALSAVALRLVADAAADGAGIEWELVPGLTEDQWAAVSRWITDHVPDLLRRTADDADSASGIDSAALLAGAR